MCIICILLYIASEKWHIIYLQLQVQARARKFYAADCSLVVRSRCIARRLICTRYTALRTDQQYMHPALPTLRAPDAPLLLRARPRVCILACSTHPASAETSAGKLQPLSPPGRGLLRPSTRGTDGRREARKARRREAAAEEATTAASGATNANRWNAEQDFL